MPNPMVKTGMFLLALWLVGCGARAQPTPVPASTATPIAIRIGERPVVAGRTAVFAIVPAETSASYSVHAVLLNENNQLVTVEGRTDHVTGEITLNYDHPSATQIGQFTVDIRTLTSDQPQRDEALRQWLDSSRYPVSVFVANEVRSFPDSPRAGQPVQFQLVGDMTIKEVTRQVTWDVTATLNLDRLVGTAITSIMLADFNVSPPAMADVGTETDDATITLDFTFKRVTPIPVPASC